MSFEIDTRDELSKIYRDMYSCLFEGSTDVPPAWTAEDIQTAISSLEDEQNALLGLDGDDAETPWEHQDRSSDEASVLGGWDCPKTASYL